MTDFSSSTTLILGAGPGGLAAGCYLAQHFVPPLIIEKESYVGGLCHTIEKDGFRFDIGGHRWFTKNPEVDAWVKELMGDEFVEVRRISRIYYNGKYFLYPLSIWNVARNVGLRNSAIALLSFVLSQPLLNHNNAAPRTMEEAYIKQFGKKLYSMFFQSYSEKVWGRNCRELSPDWVEQRTKGLSILSALSNAILGPSRKVSSLAETFHYPKTGYHRISERMAEEMIEKGGTIRFNTAVRSVSVSNHNICGVSTDTDGSEGFVRTNHIISSIPVNLLVRMLDPKPPHHVLQAANQLKFRDLITVNIRLNQERVMDDTWVYVHDPSIPFARVHEPKNWSREMSPPGMTSLVAEFFCNIGDNIWNKTDEELCDLAIRYLSNGLGFIDKKKVIGSFAFRAPRAYPVYTLDYHENLQRIKNYLSTIENLQIIGRGGTFRYNNSDHSIEMGILSAKNLLGAGHQIDLVNTAKEYLEEKTLA